MFNLCAYKEYKSLAKRNHHLPDVVGQIVSVQGSNLEDTSYTQKLFIILLLREQTKVRITVWDDQASEFRRLFNLAGRKNNVIVCTKVNPKLDDSEKLYFNTTKATKFFFDKELHAVKDYMERLRIQDHSGYPSIEDEKIIGNNLETWTIQRLLEYVRSKEKQVICRATVAFISARNGWNYMSCAECSNEVIRSKSSLECKTCHDTKATGILRFKVQLVVQDGTMKTIFVLFDKDARKLINNTAENINTMNDTETRNSQRDDIPLCLHKIEGRTMDFQVKINSFNFTTSFQTFTVVSVLREIESGKTKDKVIAPQDLSKRTHSVLPRTNEKYGIIQPEFGESSVPK